MPFAAAQGKGENEIDQYSPQSGLIAAPRNRFASNPIAIGVQFWTIAGLVDVNGGGAKRARRRAMRIIGINWLGFLKKISGDVEIRGKISSVS